MPVAPYLEHSLRALDLTRAREHVGREPRLDQRGGVGMRLALLQRA
jgi:hypothetical protein